MNCALNSLPLPLSISDVSQSFYRIAFEQIGSQLFDYNKTELSTDFFFFAFLYNVEKKPIELREKENGNSKSSPSTRQLLSNVIKTCSEFNYF